MNCDPDLLRSILLKVERSQSVHGCSVVIQGRSHEEVCEHVKFAQDVRLIDARFSRDGRNFYVYRLTQSGHEFLSAARNDILWAQAKEIVRQNEGLLTFESLHGALDTLLNQPNPEKGFIRGKNRATDRGSEPVQPE